MTLVRQIIANLTTTLVDALYPPICVTCKENRANPHDGLVCPDCLARIQFLTPPFCSICGAPYPGFITTEFSCSNCADKRFAFEYARSAIVATGIGLDLIHAFKYKRAIWLEPLLGRLLVTAALPDLANSNWDLVVPVPLYPTRERERGFNQALVLAKHLAKAIEAPLAPRLLKRTRPTSSQTILSKKERQENVRDAFALTTNPATLKGKNIILVDDVFTTGATTNACAKVLKRTGAATIVVWTLARGT